MKDEPLSKKRVMISFMNYVYPEDDLKEAVLKLKEDLDEMLYENCPNQKDYRRMMKKIFKKRIGEFK